MSSAASKKPSECVPCVSAKPGLKSSPSRRSRHLSLPSSCMMDMNHCRELCQRTSLGREAMTSSPDPTQDQRSMGLLYALGLSAAAKSQTKLTCSFPSLWPTGLGGGGLAHTEKPPPRLSPNPSGSTTGELGALLISPLFLSPSHPSRWYIKSRGEDEYVRPPPRQQPAI